MSAFVTNYSRHPEGIEEYIRSNHPNPEKWDSYRDSWNDLLNGKMRYLLLETVSKCNLRCPMCIQSEGYPQVDDMNNKLFNIILNNIKELSIPSIAMNQINEPLLDRDIFSKIRSIANLDCVMDIMMNSNAILLSEEKSKKLVESGLHRLLVGFDAASEEIYKKVRVGGSYKKVKENVLKFLEIRDNLNSKFPVLRVSFVRNSINQHEVNTWIEEWKDIADYLSVQEFINPVLDKSKDYLYPSDSFRSNLLTSKNPVCDQPFRQAVVRGNGDIIPCCNHQATAMPIGNLFEEESLLNIFNGNSCASLKKSLTDGSYVENEICRSCLST